MFPASGAWGGSSEFVRQFSGALRKYGYQPVFDVESHVDVIVIIDPRDDLEHKAFGMRENDAYKASHPEVKILHRINECDRRKNSSFMDDLLREANKRADHTVFISSWLRDYFSAKWFDRNRANSVIYNGADPSVYNPDGSAVYHGSGIFRVVTHHWSPNMMKGFDSYKKLDGLIADGVIKDVELWIIGQWPKNIEWRSAKLFPPASGRKLAGLLKQCHAYITASRWEPCGMHHIEGAQCGLPLIYHKDGGGIVEAGLKYGVEFDDNTLCEALDRLKKDYALHRSRVLAGAPDGVRMSNEYVAIVKGLLSVNKE